MSTNIQEMSGSRDRVIVRTSLIGIGANLALAGWRTPSRWCWTLSIT